MESWNRVHMDHAYIAEMRLSLIQADSFSGWPLVIRVPDMKISTLKQILRVLFFRNGIPKTLVSDNVLEFCDEDVNLCLEKVRCEPYKTPPYHLQSNGLAVRMAQTVIMGLKTCSQQKENLEDFQPRLF